MDLLTYSPLFSVNKFNSMMNDFFIQTRSDDDYGFPKVQQRVINDELVIQFALAAYPKECIHVEVLDDILTVKGDKVEDEKNLFASRVFSWSKRDLQNQWALDKADVVYENGALTIIVPKKETMTAKVLEIK